MKRHPALQQLSRDHHHALVVAHRLKCVSHVSAKEAQTAFIAYWDPDGRNHFREEEEILLPALVRYVDPEPPIIARVLSDHKRIRGLVEDVSDWPRLERLRALGADLEQHVRREERELFPLIEHSIPESELVELAHQLTERDAP
jgi:hemerythrin-like domain-containing protein